MRVYWTDTAVAHLLGIYEYISRDSKIYAESLVDRITKRSEQIATFPLSGRTITEYRDEAIREVIERPYRIIYCIKEQQIDILAVVHGSQQLPLE